MTQLEKAIEIAVAAHAGQKGNDGTPYILHSLRLMLKMKSEQEHIVAVLHDVVEDTSTIFDDLHAAGFSDNIIESLKLLTDEKDVML